MAQTTALGNMLRLLSTAFQPPTKQLAGLVTSGAIGRDVASTWVALGLPTEACAAFEESLARAYRGRDTDEVLHGLRRESTRLFLGDRPLVENSEGPWRKKAENKQGVALMVNSYSIEVADFMRSCGVERKPGYNDCIDYVENEFEFAAFLADKPEFLAEQGRDTLELLEEFVERHLKLWLPGFCSEVAAATREPYYRELCKLTGALVAEL